MVHEMSKYSWNKGYKKNRPNSTTKQHKLARKLCEPVCTVYTLQPSTVKRYLQAYERGRSIDLSIEF